MGHPHLFKVEVAIPIPFKLEVANRISKVDVVILISIGSGGGTTLNLSTYICVHTHIIYTRGMWVIPFSLRWR